MCDHHKPSKPLRKGSTLEDGPAHEQDHRRWSRRSFLRNMGVAGSMSMMLGRLPLTALGGSPLSMALSTGEGDNVLVLIRLKGGNDGLNTIIPLYDYDTYRSLRPGLGIPESELLRLSDSFGLPDSLAGLRGMWEEGQMKVVNGVGYPDQNLSHFRSSDIWASASDAGVDWESGWLGRWLGREFPDFQADPPAMPPAIQIGGSGNIIFENEDMVNLGLIVNDPEELYQIARNGSLYDPADIPECYYGEQLGYLRTVANSTFRYAEVIAEAYEAAENSVEYQNGLGRQLALVARLIKGGLATRLYLVTLDGFDTHARQDAIHPQLLGQLARAVRDFYADLGAGGHAHRVLAMTHSEFGRRPRQNTSGGTDHGAAAPLMVFGAGLNGSGFVGMAPSLQDLDPAGNLRYSTDFREVYATVLEGWLCVSGATVDAVLGRRFQRLEGLGLNCSLTATDTPAPAGIRHWVARAGGQTIIYYQLQEPGNVSVRVFNLMGQQVDTLFQGYQLAGTYQVPFSGYQPWLATGYLVYSILVDGRNYSGKFLNR